MAFVWILIFSFCILKLSWATHKEIAKFPTKFRNCYHIVISDTAEAYRNYRTLQQSLSKTEGATVNPQDIASIPGLYTFTAHLTDSVYQDIKNLPYVEVIEQVRPVVADCFSQCLADWGLRRISGRRTESVSFNYSYMGENVTVYVVDTGVDISHTEFSSRASFGACIPCCEADSSPSDSHGTHVAALVAGTTTGVAKKANIVSVRITNSDGESNTDYMEKGLRWVYRRHLERARALNPNATFKQHEIGNEPSGYQRPKSVINLSMSVACPGELRVLKLLIGRLRKIGVIIVTSAGNHHSDACSYSPDKSSHSITVACSDRQDQLCEDSNFGPCVTLLAPGSNLKSASYGRDQYSVMSGTSQSSALVSGLVAAYLSSGTDAYDLDDVKGWLRNTATQHEITLPNYANATPNLLAFSTCACDRNPEIRNKKPCVPVQAPTEHKTAAERKAVTQPNSWQTYRNVYRGSIVILLVLCLVIPGASARRGKNSSGISFTDPRSYESVPTYDVEAKIEKRNSIIVV